MLLAGSPAHGVSDCGGEENGGGENGGVGTKARPSAWGERRGAGVAWGMAEWHRSWKTSVFSKESVVGEMRVRPSACGGRLVVAVVLERAA